MTAPLLSARGLSKSYRSRAAGLVRALDGVSLDVAPGETLGIVGESGSGKTTLGRLIARLEEPDAGTIAFDGEDWLALSGHALRRRRRDLQMVFQDPKGSLNPRLTVGAQVREPLRVQALVAPREIPARVRELLEQVGLEGDTAARFPAQLSGGQRQRVAIARALASAPKLLVCDEPLSALDVSVAAQIVNLLLELREKTGVALIVISHDLAAVSRLADRVAVVFAGRVVEEGPAAEVLSAPRHPFTAALLDARPAPPGVASRTPPRQAAVDAASPGEGCPFVPRCPIARPRCRQEDPPLSEVSPGRRAACFFPAEVRPRSG
ncbi:MAG TPA: ABC transporter ATP-binding protein [Thermoanaerobaculia bacterium]|jgi:oligopeptide/dipeptide ABC transporter ATP-binding protein